MAGHPSPVSWSRRIPWTGVIVLATLVWAMAAIALWGVWTDVSEPVVIDEAARDRQVAALAPTVEELNRVPSPPGSAAGPATLDRGCELEDSWQTRRPAVARRWVVDEAADADPVALDLLASLRVAGWDTTRRGDRDSWQIGRSERLGPLTGTVSTSEGFGDDPTIDVRIEVWVDEPAPCYVD